MSTDEATRDAAGAARDLQYLRDLLARTERRVDPHSFHFIHWGAIVLVWGLAYAAMAYMVGLVYRSEYLWAGAAIFAGCLLAMALPDFNGIILGPFMGLGLLVPGLLAKRRERRLRVGDTLPHGS